MGRIKFIALLAFNAIAIGKAHAQIKEVPLDLRIGVSELIVEGRVLQSESYWDAGHGNIYTSYLVEVVQTLKGPETAQLEVVNIGGQVDGHVLYVSHNLTLSPGGYGILFLQKSGRYPPHFEGEADAWEVYAGPQGFISLTGGVGTDLFRRYVDVGQEVYARIPGCPVPGPRVSPPVPRGSSATTIDSIYPDTLSAGTRSSLHNRSRGIDALCGNLWRY